MSKPGIKTTEFWISGMMALVGPIVSICVSVRDGSALSDPEALIQSVVLVVSNISSLFAVRGYVSARVKVKTNGNGVSDED